VPADIATSDREFVKRESAELLRSLWRLIDREKWLNHPRDLWLASNKIEQLSVAKSMGFSIPETLVSCSEPAVRAFFTAQARRVICKAVKHGFTRHENTATVATTQRIDDSFLKHFHDYAAVAMIYQREIPKTFDVRVTVVGDNVFATAIHSQDHTETQVDWRLWDVSDFDLKHEPIALPNALSEACRRITRHFRLKYSAIDLVLGTDGRFYFLEMNPNGQWAWIERKAGHPIRDALIRCMGYDDANVPV
jgi:glutathione synthase/RimK-type ligase-like ATP-grasp enzyme